MSLAIRRAGDLPAVPTNGHLPPWMGQRSKLLAYLPGVFSEGEESDFLARYLLIFETIVDGVDRQLGALPAFFAPDTAPESFLPWLASWVGLVVEDGWPEERRRAVLARATDLHRWRGTLRGLREHLQLYTGVEPEIVERGSGLTLGPKSRLGHQTVLGRGDRPYHFSVVIRVPDPTALDRFRLRAIVEAQRPAHTTYALFVLPDGSDPAAAPDSADGTTARGEDL